ncbi:DddA-like double-stranded DNA deaminase toxin [Saccharopolyspora phatthalungensis]|uniref:Nucleic acid/nucleotide deaminase of polymorphic system toxin n=1 Tax=Saccharopolyspora phatthalungensis TaxID=664693 RepID=A0A840PVZ6_9PSEU|nr:DddA-like double-stranded DNA deaminase toxin [Saccharopolyspora phatthalungensis]MBB5152496.1 hypothetical protein [Saccharopolyspora phatthalungensis]
MSAVGDLDQALAQVVDRITAVLGLLVTAQDACDEAGEVLGFALDGTADPEALEVLAAVEPTSDELIHAYQAAHHVIELIVTYRRCLEVQHAIDTTPPSAAHPSTAGRIPTDAAHDRWWVEQLRQRLPRWEGGQTVGFGYDREGTEFRIASGREDISERVRLTLHNSDVFPPTDDRGPPAVFTHVETKYAQMMKESGQTYGVVVVNNRMCPGDQGCEAAVRAILPCGSVLVVWTPGRDRPIEIHGKARP